MIEWPLGETDTPVLDGLDAAQKEQLSRAAVDLLYSWTAGTFGLRQAEVRPRWMMNWGARPTLWVALSPVACGTCLTRPCRCVPLKSLRFKYRVDSIEQVSIGEGVVEPAAYELQNSRVLARIDGGGWPREGMTVSLVAGTPVPVGGQLAAAALAEELAKAVSGDDSCALPQRVQTITRQGITVGMLDGMEDLDEGRTGIWIVDSWVATVRNMQPVGGVFSPDLPPAGGWGGQ